MQVHKKESEEQKASLPSGLMLHQLKPPVESSPILTVGDSVVWGETGLQNPRAHCHLAVSCGIAPPSPQTAERLTDVLGVNGNQHVDQPLRQQQTETQQHQALQNRSAVGPHVGNQQPQLPAQAAPRRRQGGRRQRVLLDLDEETGSQRSVCS